MLPSRVGRLQLQRSKRALTSFRRPKENQMAKRITHNIKLNIPAGKGTPAPPVGPALGQAGINMMEFLKKFNEMTAPQMGFVLPVEITVFEDRSYAFVVKQPLMTDLIKRAAGIEKGAANPKTDKAGVLTREKARDVA